MRSTCSIMERMERDATKPCGPTCRVCGLVPLAPRLTGAAHVVAHSPAMQALLKRAARFAGSSAPVVIRGETGTGKEVVARVLHASSGRAKGPFVAVNVAALPAELLESELFGHGKGAFTGAAGARRGLFEEATGGTLFLDEIGELPMPLQAKLLRVLQDGEVRRVGESRAFAVDARICCATHRDLARRVEEGAFREDLYYRLKVLTLEVPPLRERHEDVLPLAAHFLALEKAGAVGFTPGAKERLLAWPWPGNVRELENAVKHGAALATGGRVDVGDLPEELAREVGASARRLKASERASPVPPMKSLAEVERAHVLAVLDACNGSQAQAARVLGIGRNTLWRKLRAAAYEAKAPRA
jgi:two-component system response regulator HydG